MKTEKTTREKVLTNKPLPLILMALNLVFFFYLIPIHIAEEYTTLLTILGGIVTLILSFWIFLFVTPKLFEKAPILMSFLSISTLFIFGYFFIVRTSNFTSNELAKNATYTEAIVTNKTKIYGKRGRSIQSINVSFITENNQPINAKISVTERYYNYISEGMRIPVVYSSKHPNIVEIDFRKFRGR